MTRLTSRRRLRWAVLAAIGCVAAGALVVLPAASGSSPGDRLFGYVIPNARGPLPACKENGSNCTDANLVVDYLYITNANPMVQHGRGPTRADVPNAFVVNRIDEAIFVNGADTFDFFFTPPPGSNFASADGRWVESACGAGCGTLGRPAVLPLENTAVYSVGWNHGDAEPDGIYVFRYTIHGTLNGVPEDVVAVSPPIQLTR